MASLSMVELSRKSKVGWGFGHVWCVQCSRKGEEKAWPWSLRFQLKRSGHLIDSLELAMPWRTATLNNAGGKPGRKRRSHRCTSTAKPRLCLGSPRWRAQVVSAHAEAWLCVDPNTRGNPSALCQDMKMFKEHVHPLFLFSMLLLHSQGSAGLLGCMT